MSMTNLECLVTEIIEPLRYPEDFTTRDSMELYNDLLNEIMNRLKNIIHSKKEESINIVEEIVDIINELGLGKEKIREIRIDEGLCQKCGNRLQTKEQQEFRGEYQGFPTYETINTQYCPNCGWTEDNE